MTAVQEALDAGLLLRDGFIAPSAVLSLNECAAARRARGEFAPARIGTASSLERRADIRGDFTCWLREPLYPAERVVLSALELLRLELNRESFLGLLELELHYAWYPAGAAYARHVDQPFGRTQRKLSLVLYLNVGWTPEAGGALRLFGVDDEFRDIEPIAGRLVCFPTSGREHEVLTAHRERLSISGWFRARD